MATTATTFGEQPHKGRPWEASRSAVLADAANRIWCADFKGDFKTETLRPPAATARAQQTRFDAFQEEFNQERPHEGIDDETPVSRYTPSEREFPRRLGTTEYPAHFTVRKVAASGRIRCRSALVTIGHARLRAS